MTRQEALAVAAAKFNEMNTALMNEWLGKGPKVDEASYGYRHGWMTVGEFSISTNEFAPANQPYMD